MEEDETNIEFINEYLSLAEFEAIIFGNNKVAISDVVLNRVNESFNFLKEFSGKELATY